MLDDQRPSGTPLQVSTDGSALRKGLSWNSSTTVMLRLSQLQDSPTSRKRGQLNSHEGSGAQPAQGSLLTAGAGVSAKDPEIDKHFRSKRRRSTRKAVTGPKRVQAEAELGVKHRKRRMLREFIRAKSSKKGLPLHPATPNPMAQASVDLIARGWMEGCAGFEPSKAGHKLDALAERLAQHNEEQYKEAFMLVAYGRLTQQFLDRESSLYSILEMPCILQAARKLRGGGSIQVQDVPKKRIPELPYSPGSPMIIMPTNDAALQGGSEESMILRQEFQQASNGSSPKLLPSPDHCQGCHGQHQTLLERCASVASLSKSSAKTQALESQPVALGIPLSLTESSGQVAEWLGLNRGCIHLSTSPFWEQNLDYMQPGYDQPASSPSQLNYRDTLDLDHTTDLENSFDLPDTLGLPGELCFA